MNQEKFNTVLSNVKELMEEDQQCRNDDWYLIKKYHTHIDKVAIETENEFIYLKDKITENKMVKFSTIERVRRSIQESYGDESPGELLPTDPQVLIRRKFSEKSIKKFFSHNPKIFEDWKELYYRIDSHPNLK